ncbi:hypothetical protein EBR78_02135 [bacterium]|nr:hypothetical protein [bacterium]
MRIFFWGLLLCSWLHAEPTYLSFPSDVSWKTQTSSHFQIVYREGQIDLASRALKAAEKAFALLTPIFPERPPLTFIVLADFQDSLNGYSLNFPYPHFVVFAAPPNSTGELAALDHWLDSVVLHEYVHTLHMYPATGAWKWIRTIFGSWVVPNGMQPQHLHEGLATFLETEFSRGGRGRSSFFQMLSRKAVENQVWGDDFVPLDLIDGSASRWPHGTSAYFFGYYFYRHLWSEKQHQGITNLVQSGSSNWPYWINIPFQEVYQQSAPTLWKAMFDSVRAEKKEELKKIQAEPLSQLTYFTQSRFQKKDLALSPEKKRVAFLSHSPTAGTQLEIFNLGSKTYEKKLRVDASDAGGLCWIDSKSKGEYFLFSVRKFERFQSRNRLALVKSDSEDPNFLKTSDGWLDHVHEISCSPDGKNLLLYQEVGGKGRLGVFEGDALSENSNFRLQTFWDLPPGTWISALSWGSPAYFLLRSGHQTVFYRWDFASAPEAMGQIDGHAYRLKRGDKDTSYLISGLSGRDEIWQWDLSKKQLSKAVSATGGFNSFEVLPETALVSSYEHGGYDLASATFVVSKQNRLLAPPTAIQNFPKAEAENTKEEDYSPWSTLIPRTWIPSALIVPFGLQVGAWIPMFDLTQRHFYDINLGFDRRDSNTGTRVLPFFSLLYGYRFGQSSVAQLNTYFLPGFLTFNRSFFQRWGTSFSYGREIPGSPIQGRLSSIFRRVEQSTLGPANQSMGLGFELAWANQQTTGVLDAPLNRGIRLSASHQQFMKALGSQDNFFSSLASFEGTVKSPIWEKASWHLTLRQGYTEGTPLYNSFFEGGGELIFSQGRGFFLNRGYLQGSFAARRIFGGNLEFQFPISRLDRGWNLWPVFLQTLSGALVLDTTSYDFGPLSRASKLWMKEFLWSTGFEIKSQWRFFYYLPTEVRLGFYRGLSRGGEPFYFTLGVEAAL